MKPLFTIHAGEYLVGSYIEEKLKLKVWIPATDTGIDLLVTGGGNTRPLSVQVKYSKDYLPTQKVSPTIRKGMKASGWWQLKRKTLEDSKADFWILVLYGLNGCDFIIAKPKELVERCKGLDRKERSKGMDIYLCVTREKKVRCLEARNLSTAQKELIAAGGYRDGGCRDFTEYLNKWDRIGHSGRIAAF